MTNTNNLSNPGTTKSDLSVLSRNSLTLTGVKKIRSTASEQVVVQLDNCTVLITGSGLNVQSASIQTGELELSGNVSGVRWVKTQAKKWSIKNMFR